MEAIINLKELQIKDDGSVTAIELYKAFNQKILSQDFQFIKGDEIWNQLDFEWKNSNHSLKDYFNSMLATYESHGHNEALKYMYKDSNLHGDQSYSSTREILNPIRVDDKNIVYNGRHRIILFHYLFSTLKINDYTIFVDKEK